MAFNEQMFIILQFVVELEVIHVYGVVPRRCSRDGVIEVHLRGGDSPCGVCSFSGMLEAISSYFDSGSSFYCIVRLAYASHMRTCRCLVFRQFFHGTKFSVFVTLTLFNLQPCDRRPSLLAKKFSHAYFSLVLSSYLCSRHAFETE